MVELHKEEVYGQVAVRDVRRTLDRRTRDHDVADGAWISLEKGHTRMMGVLRKS